MFFISMSLFPMCVMAALISMVTQRTHLLMMLLSLEAMILTLIILSSVTSFSGPSELFVILILLTFGAAEASLGLSCLVKMSRMFGNDMVASTMPCSN